MGHSANAVAHLRRRWRGVREIARVGNVAVNDVTDIPAEDSAAEAGIQRADEARDARVGGVGRRHPGIDVDHDLTVAIAEVLKLLRPLVLLFTSNPASVKFIWNIAEVSDVS